MVWMYSPMMLVTQIEVAIKPEVKIPCSIIAIWHLPFLDISVFSLKHKACLSNGGACPNFSCLVGAWLEQILRKCLYG